MNKEMYDFLLKLALRFRLSLKQLCELLGRPTTIEEQDKLFNEIDQLYGRHFELRVAYVYLFHHECAKDTLSSKGKKQFLANIFLNKYMNACRENNKEEINKLNYELLKLDEEFKKIREKSKGQSLTKEEGEIVAKYRLKYAISREDVSYILGINSSGYRSIERSFKDINLRNKLTLLNEYYMNINAEKKRRI